MVEGQIVSLVVVVLLGMMLVSNISGAKEHYEKQVELRKARQKKRLLKKLAALSTGEGE